MRVNFDGGTLSSDGGAVLLGEVERRRRILERFAGCFVDHREPAAIEHTVAELVAQWVYGLALGYEDLNDHDELRIDPLLPTVVGKADPTGVEVLPDELMVHLRSYGRAVAGQLAAAKPPGQKPSEWSTRSMAQRSELSQSAVSRIWRAFALQPHRSETFKLWTDPLVIEKLRDIRQLLHPQDPGDPPLAGPTSPVPPPLHAHQSHLGQHGRALIVGADGKADPLQRAPLDPGARDGHRALI